MNLFRITVLTIIFALSTIPLVAQNLFTKGLILNQSDSTQIVHAHIINTTTKIGVTSNKNGEFTIQTKPKDSLSISFIGYKPLNISVSEITSIIYLERALYTIEPYTVLPYKNYDEFKIAFIKLKLEDTVKHKMNPSTIALAQHFYPENLNGGITIRGPISAIAAKFNKRIKDRKHYESLLIKDKYKAYLATKFNAKIVQQATTLKEVCPINAFMEYCDFTDQFIEHSSHYTIVDQIINCFDAYKKMPILNK